MNLDELTPIDAEMNARLIDAAGTNAFGDLLLCAAGRIGGVEELFGYSTGTDSRPQKLLSRSMLAGANERVARYVARYFRHDPALWGATGQGRPGGFYRRVRSSEILPYDYRQLCFDQPHFAEKISFGWRHECGLVMLSFYRATAMDDQTVTRLARLADVALAAMIRVQAPRDGHGLIRELERRLKQARPQLTPREVQVCARIVAGWTAERIGGDLAIGMTSVHTYRRRACQRYSLGSTSDFLPDLIH